PPDQAAGDRRFRHPAYARPTATETAAWIRPGGSGTGPGARVAVTRNVFTMDDVAIADSATDLLLNRAPAAVANPVGANPPVLAYQTIPFNVSDVPVTSTQ